jgi:hypothetical protein
MINAKILFAGGRNSNYTLPQRRRPQQMQPQRGILMRCCMQ